MEAASAASAPPFGENDAEIFGSPAPPEAITGI